MKSKFLETFLDVIMEMPIALHNAFIRESMANKMIRMGGNNPDRIFKGFRNLEQRKLLIRKSGGYKLTPRGNKWLNNLKFKGLCVDSSTWDGKWRVVIFDIPEFMQKKRKSFHAKLKSLNFYSLQKSVFVCPFSCESELGFVTEYLGIREYVDVLVASSAGFREEEIREHYNL